MADAEKPPIRITKQRAQAFLDAADRGIDEQINDVRERYGIKLFRDGTQEIDEQKFALLAEGDQTSVVIVIERITRAIDTLAIFRRRYG